MSTMLGLVVNTFLELLGDEWRALMRFTDRDYETLRELEAANRSLAQVGYRGGWAKPLDCGGMNGSHHSATLAKLARARLATRKGYNPGCRPVWMYMITDAGKEALSKYTPPARS